VTLGTSSHSVLTHFLFLCTLWLYRAKTFLFLFGWLSDRTVLDCRKWSDPNTYHLRFIPTTLALLYSVKLHLRIPEVCNWCFPDHSGVGPWYHRESSLFFSGLRAESKLFWVEHLLTKTNSIKDTIHPRQDYIVPLDKSLLFPFALYWGLPVNCLLSSWIDWEDCSFGIPVVTRDHVEYAAIKDP